MDTSKTVVWSKTVQVIQTFWELFSIICLSCTVLIIKTPCDLIMNMLYMLNIQTHVAKMSQMRLLDRIYFLYPITLIVCLSNITLVTDQDQIVHILFFTSFILRALC